MASITTRVLKDGSHSYLVRWRDGGVTSRGSTGAASGNGGAPGAYEVTFPVDVSKCAYVADAGLTSNASTQPAAFVTTAGANDTPDGVFVTTYNQGGDLTETPFPLIVTC